MMVQQEKQVVSSGQTPSDSSLHRDNIALEGNLSDC